jgi:hypothetical protein
MTAPFTGGCRCGDFRFSFPAAPVLTRICWCRDCQYFAAGNATVNAVFATEGATFTGETRAYETLAESGNRLHRHFCPRCGTPLYSEAAVRPGFRVMRVGTLDEPGRLRPETAIWTRSAPAWACHDPALAGHPDQGPPPPPVRAPA